MQENKKTAPKKPVSEKTITLTACPEPFSVRNIQEQVPFGWTIAEMVLHSIPRVSVPQAHVWINGDYVPIENWLSVRPKSGAVVTIRVVPGKGGGKNPIATILTLALIVAAPGIGAGLAASTGGWLGSTFFGTTFLSAAFSGIVSVVGRLAISAIAPPPKQKLSSAGSVSDSAEKPTAFIAGAQNQVLRFNAIPRPLGRYRMVPPHGALPFTEIIGNDQYVRLLFVWGYGPLEISDLRIGDTALSAFTGVETETRQGYDSDAPLTLFTNQVNQNDLSVSLTYAAGFQVRTTEDNTDEISVDVTFPRGLAIYQSTGVKANQTVNIEVQYAPTGTASWVNAGTTSPAIQITAKQSAAIRHGLRMKVARGKYDVRLRRITADSTSDTVIDESVWTALRSIRNESPIKLSGLAVTVLRIKATDQLNGVVDRFNGVVHSILPDWNGSAWVERTTSNPASIFRHVLQGKANARPLADSRLDLPALQSWHADCAAAGREFNLVIDSQRSVHDMIANIAAVGRASPAVIDGKWRVVQDKVQTVPVQHFTPRNSFGFQGEKAFPELPHAFRVRFANRDKDWMPDERIVYDDGYTAANATKFEGLDLTGVSSGDQAWKDGRYHIATVRLRPEIYSFSTDIEHIVCTRGDLIRFTHDVLLVGLSSTRIKAVANNGTHVTAFTVDEELAMETGKSYGVQIRTSGNSFLTFPVVTTPGLTKTLTLVTPYLLSSWNGGGGDLLTFGESGKESIACLVKSIEPQADLTARITCVDAAPAVHTADTGTIPPHTSQITVPPDLKRPPTPVITTVQTGDEVLIRNASGSFTSTITMTLAPHNFPLPLSVGVKIKASSEAEFRTASFIHESGRVRVLDVEAGEYYDVQVVYNNAAGMSSAPFTLTNQQVTGAIGLPDNVINFSVTVQGQQANLAWDAVTAIDLSHYRIKWSPATSGATWASSIDLIPKVSAPMTSKSAPALTGTYLIKAVDYGGRESTTEAVAISTIAEVEGFNAVTTLTENPSFSGTKSDLYVLSNALRIQF